ncbi:MAG TPA: DUF5995 family protein [Labilithrix sp.]|nr:DUF5995 family protein [Labilithrix sp.]
MTVRTIDDVIGQLDAIITEAERRGDRVGYFAALYKRFTVAVRDACRAGEFLDAGRMERLDVGFARRYFEAIEAYRSGRPLTRTWRVAFDACSDPAPTLLQHLYAGLTAHQLLDLGIAAAEISPGTRISDLRGDFEHINQIVSRLMREVNTLIGVLSPWIGAFDRAFGVQYAAFNKIGISVARDLAWRSALELAPLDVTARGPRIARIDARSAVVADLLVRPRAGLGLVARVIRARESDDVSSVIRQLRDTKDAPGPVSRPGRRPKQKRVAVLGGGIGGLTAAHELRERGFEVEVYEASSSVGGKARSQAVRGTGTAGRKDLPGEHGFRFFPSFYRHVIDSMDRIALPTGGTVAGRILPSRDMAMAEEHATYVFRRHPPREIGDFFDITRTVRDFFEQTQVPEEDVARFAQAMLVYMISCEERRLAVHERQSFWDFLDGDKYSKVFQKYIGTTRFMVAMDPKKGSARTVATKAIQILGDFFRNGSRTDGVLDGPTTERWLQPWYEALTKLGVKFRFGKAVRELVLDGHRLSGVRLESGETIHADHYVLALPLDRAGALITDRIAGVDPALAALRRIRTATSWMAGAQFFLSERLDVCRGHVAYPDSAWALSSVCQGQFWEGGLAGYGDGRVKDILSVDVSDWDNPSPRTGKTARESNAEEVLDEVWAQLADSLVLDRSKVVARHLDENVTFGPSGTMNATPLLVHPPGSWFDRPSADLTIENLFLASDYVKTNTDLASMEGANEAARRAVNAILDTEGRADAPCRIWSMAEEAGPLVAAARRIDRDLFLLESNAAPVLSRFGGALPDVFDVPSTSFAKVNEVADKLANALRLSSLP